MTITNKVSLKSVMAGVTPIADVPDAPTIGAATNVGTSRAYNNGSATVAYTAAATGGTATTFTATSTPGSFTGTGSSPITVIGLQSATSYTFTVSAANTNGTLTSAATSSITATTVPNTPGTPTATRTNNTTVSLAFTAGATGGSAITSYTVTSSPSISLSTSDTTSPLSVTGTFVQGTAYTFTIVANNTNGASSSSSASNSVTLYPLPTVGTFSLSGTSYPVARTSPSGLSTNGVGVVAGGRTSTSGNVGSATGYYWNGSSWSGANLSYGAMYPSMAQTSSTQAQSAGGNDSGNSLSDSSYFNGSSWAAATALPVSRSNAHGGGSFGNNSYESVSATVSGASSVAVYHRTGTGAWTTGTNYPTSSSNTVTWHNGAFTRVFSADTNGAIWYHDSLGSAWTSTGNTYPGGVVQGHVNVDGVSYSGGYIGTDGIYSYSATTGVATYKQANPINSSNWSNFAVSGRTGQLQLVSGYTSSPNQNNTFNYVATVS